MTNEQIEMAAIAAHEANRAYCRALGDESQLPWANAPGWQKESAMEGVNFLLANPEAPASATHDSWFAQKERDGWKYGSVKDSEKKEHPCFVPYEQLPEAQKAKDALFNALVRGVISHYSE